MADIFTPDFKAQPYWWEAARPSIGAPDSLPKRVDVCIIGGGYAGLNCALELARSGTQCVVVDSKRIGQGASSRNGGLVSGGLKHAQARLTRTMGPDQAARLMQEAAGSLPFLEGLIARERIDCEFERAGRFACAWTPAHFDAMSRDAEKTAALTGALVHMVPPENQKSEIGSDFYCGGQVVEGAATIHPAKYVRGLAEAALNAGAQLCGKTHVTEMRRGPDGWLIETDQGVIRAERVMLATNGYTGRQAPWFRRRVVPVASFMIATEEIPTDLTQELAPNARGLVETRRVLS